MLVLVPLGTRVQALASPQSRRFAEVSLTLRLHTAPPFGFLHTRGHLECGTFGQAVPDPGVMRLRLESLYTSLLLARLSPTEASEAEQNVKQKQWVFKLFANNWW